MQLEQSVNSSIHKKPECDFFQLVPAKFESEANCLNPSTRFCSARGTCRKHFRPELWLLWFFELPETDFPSDFEVLSNRLPIVFHIARATVFDFPLVLLGNSLFVFEYINRRYSRSDQCQPNRW